MHYSLAHFDPVDSIRPTDPLSIEKPGPDPCPTRISYGCRDAGATRRCLSHGRDFYAPPDSQYVVRPLYARDLYRMWYFCVLASLTQLERSNQRVNERVKECIAIE